MTRLPTHPPANPASEVARIAQGLDRAEVRAIRDRNPLSYGQALINNLYAQGLMSFDRYQIADLSPLGLAVRAHLLAPTCNESLQVVDAEQEGKS